MQIIHINDKLEESGGTETYIRDLIPALQKQNINTFLLSMKLINSVLIIESSKNKFNWSGKIKNFKESNIYKFVDQNTVFHVHNLKEPKIMELLFKLGPVIRHLHTTSIFCPGNDKFWSKNEELCKINFGYKCVLNAYIKKCCNRHPKRLLKAFANTHYEVNKAKNKYSSFIVNSSFLYDEAIKAGYKKEKIKLISYFTNLTPNYNSTNKTPPQITFIGRLSNRKGVNYLIDAFALIVKKIPAAILNVVGRGHSEKEFFLQADKYSFKNSVRFIGWGNKNLINDYILKSTVVAFPSIYPETFGIVGIEAMIRGRPVVAFDVGGVKDWLKNNESGLLVKVKDTEGFANSIIKILEDKALAKQMGKRAREIAKLQFSEKIHLKKLVESYKNALS